MWDYLSKSFQLTILDLVFIAIVGGLLVNLFSYLTRIFVTKLQVLYSRIVLVPLQKRKGIKLYKKRLSEGKLSIKEQLDFNKKVREGTATEEEIKALQLAEERFHESLTPETRENIKAIQEKLKEASDKKNNNSIF